MTRLRLWTKRIAIALLAVSGISGAGAARAEDAVRLRLNWMWYGSHAAFALGKDKGFFKDAGIDLDIRSGNGSGSAHRLVANGDSTFSYGSCASMANLVAKGASLISVAVIDAMGTDAIIVRPDAGVSKITELKGKKILTTANAGVNTFFPLVLKSAGGTVGILGGLDDKPAEIIANGGAKPVTFAYSDFGVNQIGYCIVATKKLVADNPDLVKRFVGATIKSYKAAEANPQAAIDAMADIVGGSMAEDAGKKQALAVQQVTLGILYSKANKDKVLGMNVPSDWSDMLDLMKKYNGLETTEPATAFYTNQFLPK
jgi:NitT/TauT family transport system substrate-binding protein